jgi:hypothetical protein
MINVPVRKPSSEEESSSGTASLLDPSAESELEAKLARERRRLADIEKELKLEIQMKVRVVSMLHSVVPVLRIRDVYPGSRIPDPGS